ncbi:suppressor APC domain-containing protein 2 isoform X5 [Diaphorina citri]|uniref:Suppressor APC domain-containing protein 2 isoform X2 n=1 Tax=Diaphorina citri TaxID=121845 RepID=A0A3Q0IVE5_DIACI|nr:suppressor APC domain-containing protein 2 isoform X2 [Diaphorina citri]XP_026680254.1 suppressor APC domain-containing protein 2 isoform X5 [Diaphorina citri]
MPPPPHHPPPDGLPKPFVTALRTLFDIMDDKKTGFVKLSEIEARWQDDGTKGLPRDVLDHLRKVAPQNGLLSFERFCAGLKMSLLKSQMEEHMNDGQPTRPPSAPILDVEKKSQSRNSNTAAVRPNNVLNSQRTISMPQLLGERKETFEHNVGVPIVNKAPLYGPPKPPRTGIGLIANNERNLDKAEIRTALQNWQMGIIMNEDETKRAMARQRSVGDGCNDQTVLQQQQQQQQAQQVFKKPANKRREPRRHTLQNGIDYNMLKRMKQIELERDILMQGLQAVEKAKDWYSKQIAGVQEKMKYLGRMGSHTDQWSEAQQERIELQRARVLEVNRHLAMLTDSAERGGLPLHMNLAMHHPLPHLSATAAPTTHMLNRLKQQNHILSEEVSQKTDRITSLEREKAALLRELYQGRIPQK